MIEFEGVRRAGLAVGAAVVAWLLVWVLLVVLVPDLPGLRSPMPAEPATFGAGAREWAAWIGARLVWLLGLFALLRAARLGPRDVGWHREALPAAIAMGVLLWLSALGVRDLCSWWFEFEGREVGGALSWSLVATDLLGIALAEETVFRGFLLVQIVAAARQHGRHPIAASWLGLVATTILFVACHVPALLTVGVTNGWSEWLRTVAIGGGLLAWVFLTTGNLWWCIAAHGLLNSWAVAVVGAPYERLPIAPLLVVVSTVVGARWLRAASRRNSEHVGAC